ncbi:globin domain-containing protein, partial [Streptomyces palmae]
YDAASESRNPPALPPPRPRAEAAPATDRGWAEAASATGPAATSTQADAAPWTLAAPPTTQAPHTQAARPPSASDGALVRRTLAQVEPIADKVTSYFYALLFLHLPELRSLFPASMDVQRDRLFKALLTAAKHVDDPGALAAYLVPLGRGHRKYGTLPEHYPAVGECLLGALGQYATDVWDAETEQAWVRSYTLISQIMIDAAAADESRAPAWWQAEVVEHERRTGEIAVITVRPDEPYPFLAGQYAALETPWWPRVWRHYSFASAPRSDGLLSFHVKAVPAGWVSGALVNRARPGDVIRLGPPTGSMTVDHGTGDGLLCLGGGTGIAPIKALVEDVAERGRGRPVEVFYGARSEHDLYDIEALRQLERRHPWLSVRSVVDEGRSDGLPGRLPDALGGYGPWAGHDAYLAGPVGMIRSGVAALRGTGMPGHRIRHDPVEELVPNAG